MDNPLVPILITVILRPRAEESRFVGQERDPHLHLQRRCKCRLRLRVTWVIRIGSKGTKEHEEKLREKTS